MKNLFPNLTKDESQKYFRDSVSVLLEISYTQQRNVKKPYN